MAPRFTTTKAGINLPCRAVAASQQESCAHGLHEGTQSRAVRFGKMSKNNLMWLVINSASGSYDEAAIADLREILAQSEFAPAKVIDCQQDQLPGRKELEAAKVTQLAVFAGDGTLSAYLGQLEREGWQGEALPLPGGTQNLLCRSIFGEQDAASIAGMLAKGRLQTTQRSCLRCGEHTAIAEVLVGPGARWALAREDLREREIGKLLNKTLEITEEAATGPLVRLVEPSSGREEGYPGLHFSVLDGVLAARGYHMDTVTEWIKQGFAITAGDFREGPYDDLGNLTHARCQPTGGETIDVMIDGEHDTVTGELSIRLDQFGLAILGLPEGPQQKS